MPTKIHCDRRRPPQQEAAKLRTQRSQTCTEVHVVTKYYDYTTIEANEEKEHLLPMLQKVMRRSGNTCSLQYNYLLQYNNMQQLQLHELYNARQEYLFNRLRTAVQPLHHEQQYIINTAVS